MFWSDMGGYCRAAILFAPDRPLSGEIVVRLGLLALRDGLAVLAPPHVPIEVAGLDRLLVDGGEAAVVRAALGSGVLPGWAVLGFDVAVCPERTDPGETPDQTSLMEEGFGDTSPADVLVHACRHLLGWIDAWQEEGEAALVDAMARPERRRVRGGMRLPRTIQLDASDRSVFDMAAEPGEWAVTGTFRVPGC